MGDTKLEELEKACKKEKDHKVRTRMVAVRMVRVRNMPVEEAADILVRCPAWIRKWLRCYDEGGLQGLRDLPRCGQVLLHYRGLQGANKLRQVNNTQH